MTASTAVTFKPTATPEEVAAYRKEMLDTLNGSIAKLEAVADDKDFILAWEYGLGVKWLADGKTCACGVEAADTVGTDRMPEEAWAFVPNVTNGAGVSASVIRRGIAAEREIARCRELLGYFGV